MTCYEHFENTRLEYVEIAVAGVLEFLKKLCKFVNSNVLSPKLWNFKCIVSLELVYRDENVIVSEVIEH